MLLAAVFISQLSVFGPLNEAIKSFEALNSYSVTLRARGAGGSIEIIKYYYRKPGFVRMDFVEPHEGAVLVYDPVKKKVRLRPFGFLRALVLTLSPDSRLIRSSRGHTVDRSDIGALLKNAAELQKGGEAEAAGEEAMGGRIATLVSIKGAEGQTVDGINRYLLWLDKTHGLPIKAVAYDLEGNLTEEVLMDDLAVDVELVEGFFAIE